MVVENVSFFSIERGSKMVKLVLQGLIVIGFFAGICCAQPIGIKLENTEGYSKDKNSVSSQKRSNLKNTAGVNQDNDTRDDFDDGDFEIYGKLEKEMRSDNLLGMEGPIGKMLTTYIQERSKQLSSPWVVTGSVEVMQKGRNKNTLVELVQGKDKYTSIGQDITFRSSKASISFKLYVKDSGPSDVLKIIFRDVPSLAQPSEEVVLASYELSKLPSSKHIVINCANSSKALTFLKKRDKSKVHVVFRLQGKRKIPTTIRLDNLKVSY
jgi:hypothetical protein